MPRVDEDSKLTKALVAFKEWIPTIKPYLGERYAPLKKTPALAWNYPEVRYTSYGLAGGVVLWVLQFSMTMLLPASDSHIKPYATTGDFHVICTTDSCGKHFVINKKFSFRKFPVQCPYCQQQTGERAMRCRSAACGGNKVATELREGNYVCRTCGKMIKKK